MNAISRARVTGKKDCLAIVQLCSVAVKSFRFILLKKWYWVFITLKSSMPNHALISDFFALNITLVMSVVLTHMRKQVVHSALLNYDILQLFENRD